MKTKGFSVFDLKADVYGVPFFMPSVGVARRTFFDLVKDQSTTISKHPEDFALFHVGEFDDNVGVFVPLSRPELLCRAMEFKNGESNSEVIMKEAVI